MKKSPDEKRTLYNERIARLRQDKIAETKKKIQVNGPMDEDDYHYLVAPADYSWKPTPNHANGDFHGYLAWAENYRDMTVSFPPVVVSYSPMAGNYFKILQRHRKVRWNPDYPFTEYEALINHYAIDHGIGQVHHFCGDIRIGFSLGWQGLLDKIRRYEAQNVHDEETRSFYRAEAMLVEAIMDWIRRTSLEIYRKRDLEADPLLRDNLSAMLAANDWIAENPPRSFREACQFMSWYNIAGRSYNREGCGGQLDQLLRPYYEADKAAGLIDDEDAVYLLAGLLMSDTKYYQLGGPDADGNDITNRLSWLILEAADRLNVAANLTIRVHDGLDRAFFRRGVELLFKHKNGWPRFSGDESLVTGFMKNGFSAELARQRIAVGCNWMAIPGVEYCLNDCIKVNLARIFEVAFNELMAADAEPSVEQLWQLFEKHLQAAMEVVFKTTDFQVRTNRFNSPELFLNLFCKGPIEKGCDASYHTLDYYTIGVDGSGIAVAADSFAALEQRVEREKRITWAEIGEAIKNNYAGPAGNLIRALMQSAERFGQRDSLGQQWAVRISRLFTDITVRGTSDEGIRFIPGLFSWSRTIAYGKQVGATPNGRLAQAPINHGANPMPGAVKNGELTALSEAIAAVQCGRGNTAPFQLELDPGVTENEGGIELVMALLETHLKRGGTLININIVDAEKIRDAHLHPEQYPDLVVRVTGFTAYFMTLSPEFRQLVVDRLLTAG
ncbi:MAG: pyruvate formate lyase family protein [Bacillota bacterium]|nr:pyruvate formate lyase family protein [Bacillota bacterium]